MYDALCARTGSFRRYPVQAGNQSDGLYGGIMNLIEPVLLGISLAMDALAVSLTLGAVERRQFNWRKILLTALSFGIFQAAMPLIGWFGGSLFGSFVQTYGRILASLLLAGIGGKMICEACRSDEENDITAFNFWRLIVLSFATSIDALLIGVSYACLKRTSILPDAAVIGTVTFLISAAGCTAGRRFGNLFGGKCEILGGLVLIGIGIKVLLFG
jgi:UPF0059 membrane protein MM_0643